jgi:Cytochrome P450
LLWAQEYGPIIHLRFGSQDIIVLNTAEAADELLINRSRIYSNRAAPHVAQDIMSDGQRLVFFPYDRKYKAASFLFAKLLFGVDFAVSRLSEGVCSLCLARAQRKQFDHYRTVSR